MSKGEFEVHELKIQPIFFEDIKSGKKNFEVRKMDRDYKVGDWLLIYAWDFKLEKGLNLGFIKCEITYILTEKDFGQFDIGEGSIINPEYGILGIKVIT